MKINKYSELAMNFAKYNTADYPLIALSEEAGEVLGKIAKAARKQGKNSEQILNEINAGMQPELKESLIKELGDVLWQWQALCFEIGVSPDVVAVKNIEKLDSRLANDTIIGEGDDR